MREDGDQENFGKTLRRYRWVAGLTQEELARQSGLSVRAVSDIERGHTSRPYARTIRLLADALELDEPARTRLMSAVHDAEEAGEEAAGEEAAAERQQLNGHLHEAADGTGATVPVAAGAVPAVQGSRDKRSWQHPGSRAGRTRLAAATATVVVAGGLAGWAMVNDHVQMTPTAASKLQSSRVRDPVSEGGSPDGAQCDDQDDQGTVDLSSSAVQGTNGTFWGTLEVRYSYRCDSVFTHFDPSPAVPETKAVTVTLKILGPDGKAQVSNASGSDQSQNTNMLPISNGCAQGLVILLKLGRELASAITSCQAAPSS